MAKPKPSSQATKASKEIVKLIEDMMPANYGISLEEGEKIAEIIQDAMEKWSKK